MMENEGIEMSDYSKYEENEEIGQNNNPLYRMSEDINPLSDIGGAGPMGVYFPNYRKYAFGSAIAIGAVSAGVIGGISYNYSRGKVNTEKKQKEFIKKIYQLAHQIIQLHIK